MILRNRRWLQGNQEHWYPKRNAKSYLIGREALVNAIRHANATSIEAKIEYSPTHLRVLIRDDGCGIDAQIVQSERASHCGLLGMRERAKGIGAEVRIYSKRRAGTEVEISLSSGISPAAFI